MRPSCSTAWVWSTGPDTFPTGSRRRAPAWRWRGLVNEPLLVLADEPTGNLDSQATNEILQLFAELRDTGQTLVLVTHDARVAATAERLLSMRDGAIVEDTRLDGGLPARPCSPSWPGGRRRWGRTSGIGLAWRNVRHRPWQALLLLLALSVATTTITLAMALVDVSGRSWERVSQATNGFHVRAGAEISPDMSPAQLEQVRAELARLGDAPGVVAVGGPWRKRRSTPRSTARRSASRCRSAASPAAVDQPLVTAGHWLDDREGVVLEDGFAAASLQPGDTITIAGQRVPVRGAALTVDVGPYPTDQPAQVWISPATAAASARPSTRRLRARSAAGGPRPGRVVRRRPPGGRRHLAGGQERVRGGHRGLRSRFGILAVFVVVLTIGTAVILVAGRMAAHVRQVGTLKAVGVTPGQVTCVLLVEYLAVAVLATAVELAAGTCWRRRWPASPPCWPCTAPRPTDHVATRGRLCRHHRRRGPGRSAARFAACGAAPCAPSPATPGHPPARPADACDHRAAAPLPVWLGLRGPTAVAAGSSPTRWGLTVGITLLITALALRTGVDLPPPGPVLYDPDPISRAADAADQDRVSSLGFTVAAFLVALALINATVAAVFAAHDHARNHAIMRTVGTTRARPSPRSSSPN